MSREVPKSWDGRVRGPGRVLPEFRLDWFCISLQSPSLPPYNAGDYAEGRGAQVAFWPSAHIKVPVIQSSRANRQVVLLVGDEWEAPDPQLLGERGKKGKKAGPVL